MTKKELEAEIKKLKDEKLKAGKLGKKSVLESVLPNTKGHDVFLAEFNQALLRGNPISEALKSAEKAIEEKKFAG